MLRSNLGNSHYQLCLRVVNHSLKMKNVIPRTIFLVAIIMVLLLLPAGALAKPSPPANQVPMGGFQGTVLAGGSVVGSAISVSAWIDEEKVAETLTQDDSTYVLFITGSYSGKTVSFKVGTHDARQTSIWENEKVKTLDLSINTWPYECVFFGEVTVDGQHVPDGTEISAWIDSSKVHSTTTMNSLYQLVVPVTIPANRSASRWGLTMPDRSPHGKGELKPRQT